MRRLLWALPPAALYLWARHAYRRLMREAEQAAAYAQAELRGPW